jgi:endonuclease G
MAGLIVRRGLVRDPAYIETLRGRYGIADHAPPPPPGEARAPAPVADGFPAPPAFTPQIADADALERIITSEDNFLDIHLLQGALYAARAVARVEIGQDSPQGTGFLVGPDLFLTNCHVLPRADLLKEVTLRFDYTEDALGSRSAGATYRLAPDCYHASPPEALDYALVRVAGRPLAALRPDPGTTDLSVANLIRLGKHLGYLVLLGDMIAAGQRVNLVQHPRGLPLKVVLTQNRVVADMTATRVQYLADTINGSSGAPVCSRTWEVVALHHAGTPYPPNQANAKGQPWRGQFVANEGIPARAILADLTARGLAPLLAQA